MKDIIEIVKSLENSGLLFKGVSETIQNEAKSLSEETKSKSQGWGVNRAEEGIVRAGYGNKKVRKTTNKGHYSKMDF